MTDGYEEGQLIDGRYRVLRKIGAGGMADVYLARDETLGRQVAVKVLLSRFADDRQFVERFRREAQAAAGLNHPNIVSIYDRGQVGSTYYIVMEYLKGETLKDLIRRHGRLGPREAIDRALELLAAVQFAHEHHVVHRDVKSQNIMFDEHGRAKVTDFGIARAGDPSMTEVGAVLGTAQYLSPEQAKGQPADERSDLYSVGVVLYEMLTGRVPFKGDTAVSVALKHVNELPPEPIAVVPDLPAALNRVVLKSLAKNPDRRYNSAAQFASDLRAVVSGGPLAAAGYDVGDERTQVVAPPPGDETTRVLAGGAAAPPASTRVPPPVVPVGRRSAGPRPPRKRRRVWPWVLLAAVVVLALVGGLLLYRALSGTAVAVPDVVGRQEASAVSQLKAAGFTVETKSAYSDDYPQEGLVARQSPVGGTELREGEAVTIWVSKGPEHFQLGNLLGLTAQQAADYLESNDLVTKQLSGNSTQAKGKVYKQDPPAFETVARGDTVSFWVSKGPAQVAVPEVTGLTQSQAEAAISDAGLAVGTVSSQPSTTVPAGYVISQAPDPGTKVDKGTSVSIVVSSGSPSPSPSPSPSLAVVPDVLTMDQGTAEATLGDAGFTVAVKKKGGTGQPPGTVVDQAPAGDTEAPAGSTVTIWVAK